MVAKYLPPTPIAEPAVDATEVPAVVAGPPIKIVLPPQHLSKPMAVPPKYPRPSKATRPAEEPAAFLPPPTKAVPTAGSSSDTTQILAAAGADLDAPAILAAGPKMHDLYYMYM